MTVEEAVGQTVGFASACWENLSGAGEFQSDKAKAASDALSEWLNGKSLPVTGYRKQSAEDVAFVNRIKDMEFTLAALVKERTDKVFAEHGARSEAMRQAALAKTKFEEGFMHFVRSVFLPESPWEN